MTVAEFISFWNSINISNLSIKYYYKNTPIYLHNLCNIKEDIVSIKLEINQNKLCEDNLYIYSDTYEEFNLSQQQFYDTLRTVLPDGSFVYTLNIYIN